MIESIVFIWIIKNYIYNFYQIARNFQTRSLNVDACSVFFYGLLRDKTKKAPITEKFDEKENIQITIFDYAR